ncbi:hypothetical protein MIND_00931200 [Mycena indigotica]|uniref:Uncharacterized protein n=1 Tax=Mycena indigotica TaxID=2126181 RepID=A0A8H6SCN7_9AGAR|nr:uncharacterized protein MIND_00931200 [Mycena indigotica]KAF7296989.1 hypothetical protein MIND_00931200 [Mycena indigotica]
MSVIKSRFPPLPPTPDVNIFSLMFGRPDQAAWPDYVFQVDDKSGKKRMFSEAPHALALAATALGPAGLGLQPGAGEVIGLVGNNSFEYYDMTLGLLSLTVPFALISSYSTQRELVHALKLTKATRLFVDAKLLKNVLAALDDPQVKLTPDKVYILAGAAPHGMQSFAGMVDKVKKSGAKMESVRPATKDTLAYLIMSSGTSGLPKAVMISHGNLYASAFQAIVVSQTTTPFNPPTPGGATHVIGIGTLPMFHSYGLHVYVLRSTLMPATVIFLEKWDPVKYLNCVVKYKATHLTLVPSLIHQLVNHPDFLKTDMSSVVFVNSGAAYLPPALSDKLLAHMQKGADLHQGYGLSEGTLAATCRVPPGLFGNKGTPVGSQGMLLPGIDARLVLEDGKSDAAVNEVGELWLRGPSICLGYWNNPSANASTFVDGWLRTGDQFRMDEEGFFFFADRGKDTLKVSGIQVSPKEIEDVLLAHPDKLVTDVSVAGVSGGRTADEKVPHAWVVLSATGRAMGEREAIRALVTWHEGQLSRYKWLRGGIEVVQRIPKTPTGKTLRRELQAAYEERIKGQVQARL